MENSTDKFLKGLIKVLKQRELKPSNLSSMSGKNESYIRDLLRGKAASPKLSSALEIANALNLSIDRIIEIGGDENANAIPLVGKVGAGAKVPVFEIYEGGEGPRIACPPGMSLDGITAVQVEGDSMAPIYSQGDVLLYSRTTHEGVPAEAIGTRSICEDSNGMGWVKLIKPGTEPGLYHLIALNPDAQNQHDVKLKWAAPVRLHWPVDLVRTL